MSGSQCCENPPALSSSCGSSGSVLELGGLKAYATGPSDSKLAILLISDVFGYEAPNLRKLAEKVAAAGFYVVVPDFFYGDPYSPSNSEKPLPVWIQSHGTVSKVVVELGKSDYIQAAVLLHPSLVTVDDIKELKAPIAILGAEVDRISPPELLKKFEEVLSSRAELNGYVKIFPGTSHGWTVRYNIEDETAVKHAEEAHQNMLDWFVEYVKSFIVVMLFFGVWKCSGTLRIEFASITAPMASLSYPSASPTMVPTQLFLQLIHLNSLENLNQLIVSKSRLNRRNEQITCSNRNIVAGRSGDGDWVGVAPPKLHSSSIQHVFYYSVFALYCVLSMIELSRTQDEEVGDGTTSVIVLACEMLHVTEAFIDKSFHPTVICRAYGNAFEDAIAVLDKIAMPIDVNDRVTMMELVKSCIGTKFTGQFGDLIAYIARISEHAAIGSSHGNKAFLDGSDLNSRHVKHLQ
ncbi:hypothetical protein RHMOL_Rhmol01G0364900 [Rhododendron molle]|uniref:Uncharacterized protein n=1 Tax=Rhododendron molle TaxID=49168 RepID=A0ACC0QBB1_RHOML|nr:hypothetical protein RHMOL_Rhmol01G0364900 [Rhododendron molle]